MSYGIYIGKNHSATGHAWLGGYGDEPSSHWLEIVPKATHAKGATIEVGVSADAAMPGVRSEIPQVENTHRHIRVSYSYYLGVPAPITNGGLNEYGVAVRDIWSTSRAELVTMTPKDQSGPNYSDLARIVLERATSARHAVTLAGDLINTYGESTYGGNSHLFADAEEAWVMIQYAGGQGLWVAERMGPDSIRASRPGYVFDVPVTQDSHPDFLWCPNLVSFAQKMGWYSEGLFNVNTIYGDSKGRWEGIKWIEAEMLARALRPEKIGLSDVIWAVRTPKLTGDTAGYGQVVPLVDPVASGLRMLWHAPIGAVAAPFAPVFMGQDHVPPEFGMHRYLTVGESHRFVDMRKALSQGMDVVSKVPQGIEAARSAVYECKRLMYLLQLAGVDTLDRITGVFEAREKMLAGKVLRLMGIAEKLASADEEDANAVLGYLSQVELLAGLDLVIALSGGLEAELRATGKLFSRSGIAAFDQLW
ncbi:MAG: dipeptidase [Paracoccaceae bacterium]|jgi:dipeptidase